MNEHIYRRVLEIAEYIVRTKATVRKAARVFGVSKSTVHKDVTERLRVINKELYQEVNRVLQYNKAMRHLRGGAATRRKYRSQKKSSGTKGHSR